MLGEVLGVERRRRWSEDEKLEILSEVGVGGASVTQVAQRHEITRSQIYGWRRDLKKKGLWSPDRGAVFLPVDFSGAQAGAGKRICAVTVWPCRTAAEQRPLPEVRQRHGWRGVDRLHADDTPVRVLDQARRLEGLGKGVKEGRIWTYLRDDRPWGGTAPPGIAYFVRPEQLLQARAKAR